MTHKEAPVERVAALEGRVEDAYAELADKALEVVVLATCNRFEVYAIPLRSPREVVEAATRVLGDLAVYARVLEGWEAARHLFRVAAGLESMILGEPEVLGQVRQAYEDAAARGFAGKWLSLLFTWAVRAGKRVRSETRISEGSIGFPGAAVRLAERLLGSLSGITVAVAGAGKAGRIIADLVASRHRPAKVIILNRTLSKAVGLAEELKRRGVEAEARPLTELAAAVREARVAFLAVTGGPVVRGSELTGAEGSIIIDISIPPAVEPPLPPGVEYHGFREVAEVAAEYARLREAEARRAEEIVEEELEKLANEWRRRQVDEAVKLLVRYAESIAEAEAEKALARIGSAGNGCVDSVVRSLARSVARKVIHTMVEVVRGEAARGNLAPAVAVERILRARLGDI